MMPRLQLLATMSMTLASNGATTWHKKAIVTLSWRKMLHVSGSIKWPLRSLMSAVNTTARIYSLRKWGTGPTFADFGICSYVGDQMSLKVYIPWHFPFRMLPHPTLSTSHNRRTTFHQPLREPSTFSSRTHCSIHQQLYHVYHTQNNLFFCP